MSQLVFVYHGANSAVFVPCPSLKSLLHSRRKRALAGTNQQETFAEVIQLLMGSHCQFVSGPCQEQPKKNVDTRTKVLA
jgi:hypothetical protein